MAKNNIYSKVDFTKLKRLLSESIEYLNNEPVDKSLEDSIEWKFNKQGGVNPQIVSTLERKIETQMSTLETCSKILKSIFEKDGLTEEVKKNIEDLTKKLDQIEEYYTGIPLNEIEHRFITKQFNKGPITFLASSREDRIMSRGRVLEKIFKVKPLITELENEKEEYILKGQGDLPESMMYD